MVIIKKDKMKNKETNTFLCHQLLSLFPSLTFFPILMSLERKKKIGKSLIVLNGEGSWPQRLFSSNSPEVSTSSTASFPSCYEKIIFMFKEIIELKSVRSNKKTTFKNPLSKKKNSKKTQYQTIQSSQHIALTPFLLNHQYM